MSRAVRLDELGSVHEFVFTDALAGTFKERSMVCFDVHRHRSGVEMAVNYGEEAASVRVLWTGEVDDSMRRAHADLTKRVDDGASAIALMLVNEFQGLTAVEISSKRNGIDYFLVGPNANGQMSDHLIFNHSAVLEVSGIQSEQGANTIRARVREKRKRLEEYARSATSKVVELPTLICVVEFSQPKAQVEMV